jgi:hypothetical protein
MITIHVQLMGDRALVPRSDLQRLVELARMTEPVELKVSSEELTTADMMRLAERGGAFDFWNEAGEDIYSLRDGASL